MECRDGQNATKQKLMLKAKLDDMILPDASVVLPSLIMDN